MSHCQICKSDRRQLLRLLCSHDVCIRCAVDNYFINCKNALTSQHKYVSLKAIQNNYYCQKCLEQTVLDRKTVQQLQKYFIDNTKIDEKQRSKRKDKIIARQNEKRNTMNKLNTIEGGSSSRPKSMEIQIAERKRTLSKYLNRQQVQKFMEMQNEYQHGRRNTADQLLELANNGKMTPQIHKIPNNSQQINEYELSHRQSRKQPRASNNIIQDSFSKYDPHQQLRRLKSEQRQFKKTKIAHNQKKVNKAGEMEYELYHNGKGVSDYDGRHAEYFLQEEKAQQRDSRSRYSSGSSAREVGKIGRRRSPRPHDITPVVHQERKQRLSSCKSDQHLTQRRIAGGNQTKLPDLNGVQHRNSSGSEWEADGKSTKRYEQKTTLQVNLKSMDIFDKILDTLETSHNKNMQSPQKESIKVGHSLELEQTYFCKIHSQEEIIYFCLRCNQLICSECGLRGAHKNHQIYSLRKSNQIIRQNLLHHMNHLSKMMVEQQGRQKILGECVQELRLQKSKQQEKIRESFESFIFNVDKKYKELLKQVESKYGQVMSQYEQKLAQCRNAYVTSSKIKDSIGDTLDQCKQSDSDQEKIGTKGNKLGQFHVKISSNKKKQRQAGIHYLHLLMERLNDVSQYLKGSNALLFSNKKQSLLSERSSLKLSDSSNLLEEDMMTTPATKDTPLDTPTIRLSCESPKRRKKIQIGGFSLNVSGWVRLVKCGKIVEGLQEIQQIISSLKLQNVDYGLKALA